MQSTKCVLPCDPSIRVIDRFSILDDSCEDSDGLVSFWPLLERLLSQDITTWAALLDLLETISASLHGSSAVAGDYGSLRLAIEEEPSFFTDIWPSILGFAKAIPMHFPAGSVLKLVSGQTLSFSQSQCASLLAHQFLCSIPAPRAEFYDFSVWYDSRQRHPVAVSAYLKALLVYFRLRRAQNFEEPETPKVEFTLWSADTIRDLEANARSFNQDWKDVNLSTIKVLNAKSHSTKFHELDYLGLKSGCVISANKDIGFGQSATQEELHLGAAPESCIAVLFTSQLEDNQALSINSAQPMIRFEGQRRNISWAVHDPPVAGGRLLLMDALEIDLTQINSENYSGDVDCDNGLLPDLLEENMQREITKARAAFTSWPLTPNSTVVTGQWGCGAFNGEPTVKLLLVWVAASLSGRELKVIFDEAEAEYGVAFEDLLARLSRYSVSDAMTLLRHVPKNIKRLDVLSWLNNLDIEKTIEPQSGI